MKAEWRIKLDIEDQRVITGTLDTGTLLLAMPKVDLNGLWKEMHKDFQKLGALRNRYPVEPASSLPDLRSHAVSLGMLLGRHFFPPHLARELLRIRPTENRLVLVSESNAIHALP